MMKLTCGLIALFGVSGQIQETRQEWQVARRWQPGMELTYRGKVREQSTSPGVAFQRDYQLESRMLVLDQRRGASLCGFLTRLSTGPKDLGAVRLETASVEANGRIIPQAHFAGKEPDGPETWEHGYVLEIPQPVLSAGTHWLVAESARPLKRWEVQGTALAGGIPCLHLQAVQVSPDWTEPRADRTAWRVEESLWLSTRTGFTQKFERVLRRRSPARQEPDFCVTTSYELESSLQYEGTFFVQRRRDIEEVNEMAAHVRAMQDGSRPANQTAWKALQDRIDRFLQQPGGSPFRDGIHSLRALAAAAAENRLRQTDSTSSVAGGLNLGTAAPEFVTQEVHGEQTVTLQHWRGKVVLMAFFLPQSPLAQDILLLLQRFQESGSPESFVAVALSMRDNPAAEALRRRLNLTYPLVAGTSLRRSYAVDATPRFVLLDADGRVLHVQVGWGPETERQLSAAVHKANPVASNNHKP